MRLAIVAPAPDDFDDPQPPPGDVVFEEVHRDSPDRAFTFAPSTKSRRITPDQGNERVFSNEMNLSSTPTDQRYATAPTVTGNPNMHRFRRNIISVTSSDSEDEDHTALRGQGSTRTISFLSKSHNKSTADKPSVIVISSPSSSQSSEFSTLEILSQPFYP